VLQDICTLVLEVVGQAEKPSQSQREEYTGAETACPRGDGERGDELGPELVTPVKQTIATHSVIRIAEKTERHYAPKTARSVHRHSVDHIVHFQDFHEHRCGLVDHATQKTDDQSLPRLHKSATSGDGHKACQNAITKAADIEAIRCNQFCTGKENEKTSDARSQGGVRRNEASLHSIGLRVHLKRTSGIEAIPAKPKAKGPKDDEWDVVGGEILCRVFCVPFMTGSDNDSSAQGAYTTNHVNEAAACKVLIAWK
jgi:hypothetical protein